MSWDYFIYFSSAAVILWIIGAVVAFRTNRRLVPTIFTGAGLVVFFLFIVGMWISLERPPLRTMGETRLWYSFFLPVVGLITYERWRYKWLLSFSTLLATVFIVINIVKPEIHNKVLMPALQSPWFSPHVIIYMFSYAILGAVTLVAIYYLIKEKKLTEKDKLMAMTDNLVYVGTAFITIGMLLGAIWAKEAWGHYWSWDPKETWAAATWISYLIYIHIRLRRGTSYRTAMIVVIISFVILQICWWGLNYLPSAQQSIHVYS
ncbi:MAG: cytochrome c biogenesis protein CcsA [Bacteroidales bacterium]|nr:cytochrome c biogenesis protein CcsA [Bacteroidales bacterium]